MDGGRRIQDEHLRFDQHCYQRLVFDESRRWYLFWSSVTIFVATATAIIAGAFVQVIFDRSKVIHELSNVELLLACIVLMAVAAGATLHHYSFKAKLRPKKLVPLQGVTVTSATTGRTHQW